MSNFTFIVKLTRLGNKFTFTAHQQTKNEVFNEWWNSFINHPTQMNYNSTF
jgi:hypothetical protein